MDKNYLTGRKQCVVLEGCKSHYKFVLSGVPQGSILGPLLFLYFINDMSSFLNHGSKLYQYTDDSKLCLPVETINDCFMLQQDLLLVLEWSSTWGMNFNTKKCNVMSFFKNHRPIIYDYVIVLNDSNLNRVSYFNDLGVTVSSDLTWNAHVENCIKKANKRLGLVKRCTGFTCPSSVKKLCYTALVRPLVEFNSTLWSGVNKKKHW